MNETLFLEDLAIQIRKILTTLTKQANNELIRLKDLHATDMPYITKFYNNEDKTLTRFDNAYFLFLEQKVKDQKYNDEMENLK